MSDIATTTGGYVNLEQAADWYGISQHSVRRLIADGDPPAYRIGKRQIRIKFADLEALADPILPDADFDYVWEDDEVSA